MQKEIENREFVQGVNFEFIDSLKNNGTKYLLIFDDSCEEICNSKAFVDIATAGRHRGLSTIYIKHNLFHHSKLGRDVELQNTHIVLCKSPRGDFYLWRSQQQDGDKKDVTCYRPINLLSCISKVLERIIFDEIYPLVQEKLHTKQFGFRRKRSATLQLLLFLDRIYK